MTDEVKNRFINDPQWGLVEQEILDFITPLLDMTTIDTSLDGDTVRAEVIGRKLAYDSLIKFCRQSRLVSEKLLDKPNIFR